MVLVAGGYDGQARLASTEVLPRLEGVWRRVGSLPTAVSYVRGATLGNTVYMTGESFSLLKAPARAFSLKDLLRRPPCVRRDPPDPLPHGGHAAILGHPPLRPGHGDVDGGGGDEGEQVLACRHYHQHCRGGALLPVRRSDERVMVYGLILHTLYRSS